MSDTTMGMIEFMVCSLINDDNETNIGRYGRHDVDAIPVHMSLKHHRTIVQLWVGFMVRAYSDSLSGRTES